MIAASLGRDVHAGDIENGVGRIGCGGLSLHHQPRELESWLTEEPSQSTVIVTYVVCTSACSRKPGITCRKRNGGCWVVRGCC